MSKLKYLYNKYWRYDGRPLANPLLILWRLLWLIPLFISKCLVAFMFLMYTLDFETAKDHWNNT